MSMTQQNSYAGALKEAPSWMKELEEELNKPYVQELAEFLRKERASGVPVYPPKELVFNAFKQTPFDQVKVVIIGQDPYHGAGQAHGLSFSVPVGIRPPPSLKNIFQELANDIHISPPTHGCLLSWAQQGVLLLNATLTVREGEPRSHAGKGWERFTDAVVSRLVARLDPVIFVLWGKFAQEKCEHILDVQKTTRHFLLAAPHPSPYSVHSGFFGCRHFSKINELLVKQGKSPINWEIQ